MTEYIDIQTEATPDPNEMRLITNLDLVPGGGREVYQTPEEGDEGSPLAQALFAVPGLQAVILEGSELLVRRQEGHEWHDIIEDITDVLRDFFL